MLLCCYQVISREEKCALPFRPKLFLTLSIFCVTPLLILSLLNSRSGLTSSEALLRGNLEDELSKLKGLYQIMVREHEEQLVALANGPLPNQLRNVPTPGAVALIDPVPVSATPGVTVDAASARRALEKLPLHLHYALVAFFDSDKHLIFLAEPGQRGGREFRTEDFVPGRVEVDPRVWQATNVLPLCSIASDPTYGEVRRCSVPIILPSDSSSSRGALVADIKLDLLFSDAVQGGDQDNQSALPTRLSIVLNSSGKVVYHPNDALRHQPIDSAIPGFAQIAGQMMASKERGAGEYRDTAGDTWMVAYEPVDLGLSLAVARNYTQATQAQRWAGWLGAGLSILFGLGGAALLTAYFHRKTLRIEEVTERVAAIARGDLDQRVEAPSSDVMRPIAASVIVMSDRLRQQIARETEAHQFQSFVKLSALLTHDLKNAIEALSLTVGNMERHHDNPEFRADALKGLTSATDKLRALVGRLSNPVNTLSGEFKRPHPIDLVPLLSRVLVQTADPLSGRHEIDMRLPARLFAMADVERIEKVIENLLLNALEAMSGKRGKLTIAAGATEDGKVFFSVTDTGAGMSPEFIEQQLFRPFATTKERGVGLGLYTCREVVRANGGTIEVDSRVGSGTTIRVVLASADKLRMKAEG
jgi:signal transduction histidine kinase